MTKNTLRKLAKHPGFWVNPENNMIYWRKTIKGKRFKKSTGTTKIKEAKKIIEDFELSLSTNSVKRAKREKRGVKDPFIEAIWNDLIEERIAKSAESTLKGYDVSWNIKLKPFWGNKQLSDMNEKTVRAFENWFLKNHKGKVFFNTAKHLRMLINYMVRENYLEKKIEVTDLDTEVINRNSKKEKGYRVYTSEEQRRILNASGDDWVNVALVGFFDTGVRKMELLSRKWDEVDFQKNFIKIWSQKNKEWRKVPLTKRFSKALKDHKKRSDVSPFIFPSARDPLTHVASQVFDKSWVRTKKLAGISGRARVHDIRHTFATRTAETAMSVPIACTLLDMSIKVYCDTYVHISDDQLQKAIARMLKR